MACRTLGALAEKCHAYAKALHYKELEFKSSPESCVESLISINNQLRQPEAAIGILVYAQQTLHMELKVTVSLPPDPSPPYPFLSCCVGFLFSVTKCILTLLFQAHVVFISR